MPAPLPAPTFFATAAEFRLWLEQHHASAHELYIGFYKQASGKVAMTYEEAVDEALCFGWIDGMIKSLGRESYMHRFSPRKSSSIWSNVNVRHVERLTKAGKMHARGLAAFAARKPNRVGIYSFENRPRNFPPALEKTFRADRAAWRFWTAQPQGYRRTLIWWVLSAKLETTRQRRLAQLIAESAAGRRV